MTMINDFSGIWLSKLRYTSGNRPGEFEVQHYSKIHRKGKTLVIESVAGGRSYRIARLSLDGRIATGSWEQVNAEDGYYKGVTYHGAVQFVVDEDGKALRGMWIGFGQNMKVKSGPWEVVYVGEKVPEGAEVAVDTGDPLPNS